MTVACIFHEAESIATVICTITLKDESREIKEEAVLAHMLYAWID